MLFRLILIAVAISYVICVLLLSGLQKEDLDANIVEKLHRHNVNILYNVSNENFNNRCFSQYYSDANTTNIRDRIYNAAEEQNETLVMPLNKQDYNKDIFEAEGMHTSEIIPEKNYFIHTAAIRNLTDDEKIRDVLKKRARNGYADFKTINVIRNEEVVAPGEINENTDPMEYVKRQSYLENFMNFWNTMSQKATTIAIYEASTTNYPIHRKPVIDPNTLNIKISNDMQYINRIIAEYLINQTAKPTESTIEVITIKNKDTIFEKIKIFLEQQHRALKTVEYKRFIIKPQNIIDRNVAEANNAPGVRRQMAINNKNDCITQPAPYEYIAPKIYNYNNNREAFERLPTVPYISDNSGGTTQKEEEGKQSLQYLDSIFGFNKQLNLNVANPYKGRNIQSKENNEGNTPNNIINSSCNTKTKTNNNKNSFAVENNKMHYHPHEVYPDLIQTIVEKVKEIVINDLRKETPTSFKLDMPGITLSTTTSSIPTIVTNITDKNTTQQGQNDKSQMIQTLMEMIKSLNTLKENITEKPKNVHSNEKLIVHDTSSAHMFPPVISSFGQYNLKTSISNLHQKEKNQYSDSFVGIPFDSTNKALQQEQFQASIYPKNKHKSPAITIQTNSNEIPPLVIPMSKPMKVINQQVTITTQNPFKKDKEELSLKSRQQINKNPKELDINDLQYHHSNNPIYEDLIKKLNIAATINKEFIDSYKGRIEKLKDIMQDHEDSDQKVNVIINEPRNAIQRVGISRFENPNHYGTSKLVNSNLETISQQSVIKSLQNQNKSNYLQGSNHHQRINWPISPLQRETIIKRPLLNYKYPETQRDKNNSIAINRSQNWNRYRNINQALDANYEAEKRGLNFQILNNPISHISPNLDPKPREYTTNEILSQLVDSKYRDALKRLIESRTINYQANHPLEVHNRNEQPNTKKKYEKFARSENMTVFDGITSRQQMPLTKVKQRKRFDDTHFRNFIKSQQRVNDMLAKMLAARSSTDFQSVEAV